MNTFLYVIIEVMKELKSRQEQRSEETKTKILKAAKKLFVEQGFDAVTMREIAKAAGCSHTTIYIYFTDKEALLHQLSIPPLTTLKQKLCRILDQNKEPEAKFKEMNKEFIHFCLANRNMYTIFFTVQASRVDEEPELEINKLRLELFQLLTRSLSECLQLVPDDDRLLSFSRICFYTLFGIVGTYNLSVESHDELMERLAGTFDDAFDALLIGFRHKLGIAGEQR